MAELRAYCCSSRHIETKHIKKTEAPCKVTEKVLNKVSRAYRKASEDMIYNIAVLNHGKVSQLSSALKMHNTACRSRLFRYHRYTSRAKY